MTQIDLATGLGSELSIYSVPKAQLSITRQGTALDQARLILTSTVVNPGGNHERIDSGVVRLESIQDRIYFFGPAASETGSAIVGYWLNSQNLQLLGNLWLGGASITFKASPK